MIIRWQRVPGTQRLERVYLPRPARALPETAALPFKPIVRAAPLHESLPTYYRRVAAERAKRAQTHPAPLPDGTRIEKAQLMRALTIAGLTQRELAAKLDVGRSSVAETARGRRRHADVVRWTLATLAAYDATLAAPAATNAPEATE